MDILHLIDRLEEMVAEARKLPVGGGVVVSRQRLLDLVDRMRVALPREVYDAREVIEKQEEALAAAETEAQGLLARAREEIETKLKDTEVVKAAEERARQVVADAQAHMDAMAREVEAQSAARLDDAQQVARDQMREADVYALQTLRKLEAELQGFIATVQRGMETLEKRAAERPGAAQPAAER